MNSRVKCNILILCVKNMAVDNFILIKNFLSCTWDEQFMESCSNLKLLIGFFLYPIFDYCLSSTVHYRLLL